MQEQTADNAANPGVRPVPTGLPVMAVDISQAAQMIGVSDDTIRREIDRGRLRAARVGRLVRIRVVELTAYLKRSEGA
jgi:excisionase family DNA binding protein